MTTTETQAGAKCILRSGEMRPHSGTEAGAGFGGGDVYHIARMLGDREAPPEGEPRYALTRPYAACSKRKRLGAVWDAADVPEHIRCQRSGCRQRWPKGEG